MRPFNYYVLSHDPPILCCLGAGRARSRPGLAPWVPADLRPVVLLEYPLSLQNEPEQMEQMNGIQAELERQGIEHHFMLNTPEEDLWRRECGVRGANLSQNAFVNEHVFSPADVPKRYDAIHIAGMYDCKRHELARNIRRLFVVTYNGDDLHAYRPELRHAEFNRRYLRHPEVAELINAAASGLCLSAVEGAMFASMEYLMCGVPVVTTPSKGGRDEFFDESNSIVVEPDPGAVLAGAEAWKRSPPDPGTVRAGVLRQVEHIRQGFCGYVAGLISERAGGHTTAADLMKRFYSAEGIAARALPISRFTSARDVTTFRYDEDALIPGRVPGYKERMEGEALHLVAGDGVDMTTDAAGAIVWGLCDGTRSVADIARLIAGAYERDFEDVRAHVTLTLRSLELHGLVS